jgi:hypothetical protein
MICKNCGAELEDNVLECPFCLSENTELADKMYEKQFEEVISKIENVKEEAKKEEKKISKKAVKIFFLSMVVLLAIIVLRYVISEVSSIIEENREKKKEAAYLAEIDVYYQKGDYEGLYEYDDNNSVFSYEGYKYSEVASAWGCMANLREFKEKKESGEPLYPILIYVILKDFNKFSKIIEEKTTDNTVFGNEQILLDFMAEYTDCLNETLGLTEAQIETIKELQLDSVSFGKDDTLLSLVDEICDRLGINRE